MIHIEDLEIKAFIDAVKNIGNMQGTEKLDGANLWFGLDDEGKMYTTRSGKNKRAQKFYSDADYPYFAANNGFRGVHAALQAKESIIKKYLSPGDTVELEVMYGRQPNAVTYGLDGKNFVAILGGVEGTPQEKVDEFANAIDGEQATVPITIVTTPNGTDLDRTNVDQTFKFVPAQKIDSKILKSASASDTLKKLEDFLQLDSGVNGLSNFDLLGMSLAKIPKEERESVKAAKDALLKTVEFEYKVPAGSDRMTELARVIKFCRAALV